MWLFRNTLTVLVIALITSQAVAQEEKPKKPRFTVVLSFVDTAELSRQAKLVAKLNPTANRELAVVLPSAAIDVKGQEHGLAFSGSRSSPREVAYYQLGLLVMMGLRSAIVGDNLQRSNILNMLTQLLSGLDFDESLIDEARALRKATNNDAAKFLLFAQGVSEALPAQRPELALAYGIGLASGQLLIGMDVNEPSFIRQARAMMRTLVATSEDVEIESAVVDLARDLLKATQNINAIDARLVKEVFNKHFQKMGLIST